MKTVEEHYLLVLKICIENVLYNFYLKVTVTKKNVRVTKNVETVL